MSIPNDIVMSCNVDDIWNELTPLSCLNSQQSSELDDAIKSSLPEPQIPFCTDSSFPLLPSSSPLVCISCTCIPSLKSLEDKSTKSSSLSPFHSSFCSSSPSCPSIHLFLASNILMFVIGFLFGRRSNF